MKKTQTLIIILALLSICFANITNAQQKQNPEVLKRLQQQYNSLGGKAEITYEQFLKANSRALNAQATSLYNGCDQINTICSDFENGLDMNELQGAYGTWPTGDPDPSTLTEGFISGSIDGFDSHQTIVSTANDPTVAGISTTNSNNPSSHQALRLGNRAVNMGTELVSKTFEVKAGQTIIKFSYALVFQNPFDHSPEEQPAFSVRVFDCATGQELTGVCDLGNGSNKAISDHNNPFFKCAGTCDIVYRDWTQSQINLSAYIGKTVNIQFLNKDCSRGGHYGYTYLDDIGTSNCVINVTNPFHILKNLSQTDSCGKGQICVDYVVPYDSATNQIGEVNIDLDIYQNGSLVKTLNSDTLRADSGTYCFSINPKTLGIDTSLDAFDYALTGNFSITGTSLGDQTLGNPPDGQVLGFNNDYYTTTCPIIGNPDHAPVFVYPPTPANGITTNAHPGETVMFTIKAKDIDAGDHVTLTATGVPAGAVITPALPKSGNPVSVKFMWTPGAGDVGTYPIQFTATDDSGKIATTTVIVQVTSVSCGDTSFRPFVYVYPLFTVANQANHTIYKGYGQQGVNLVAVPRGGSGNLLQYRFKWDNGSRLPIRHVSPDVTTTYNVDITDGTGCMAHASVTIHVVDVRCGANNDKVQVCVGQRSLCVDSAQVDALIKGGAKLGSCGMMATAPLAQSRMATPEVIKAAQPGSFTAYPNPAVSTIRFKWDVNATGNTKINILDLQGRVLISQSVTTTGQTINVGKLSNGVYSAQLIIDGRQMGMTRFTISR